MFKKNLLFNYGGWYLQSIEGNKNRPQDPGIEPKINYLGLFCENKFKMLLFPWCFTYILDFLHIVYSKKYNYDNVNRYQ